MFNVSPFTILNTIKIHTHLPEKYMFYLYFGNQLNIRTSDYNDHSIIDSEMQLSVRYSFHFEKNVHKTTCIFLINRYNCRLGQFMGVDCLNLHGFRLI